MPLIDVAATLGCEMNEQAIGAGAGFFVVISNDN
jgi:hypothetical protein